MKENEANKEEFIGVQGLQLNRITSLEEELRKQRQRVKDETEKASKNEVKITRRNRVFIGDSIGLYDSESYRNEET